MSKNLIIMISILSIFLFTGCNSIKDTLANTDENKNIIAKNGYAEGKIGDTLESKFFEYTVQSAQYVEEYAGYKPSDGNVLIDTVIMVKNIFGKEITMFSKDFQIQWNNGEKDFGYPIEAIDATMIPQEFKLKKKAAKQYHCVYEVPKGYTKYSISYLEYFDHDKKGDFFFVYFELE